MEESLIKVEYFMGDILIFAGDDNQLWPSSLLAQINVDHANTDVHLNIYEGAGHIFYGDETSEASGFGIFLMGGDEEGNLAASQAFFDTLIEFVNGWHLPEN